MNDEMRSEAPALPEPQLSAMETRLLGSLMEKQLTTPDAYPLTLNSLLLACNQKTSREPVTNYTAGEIAHCLRELENRKLVEVDHGSRADRYAQRLTRSLGIDKKVQAVLNVLLLRGPQTVHELLTRTQRMHEFGSDQEVEELLEHLAQKVTPIIQRVPRQPGQREDRFVHLLSGKPDLEALAALSSSASVAGDRSADPRLQELEQRVALLERKVALLMELGGITEDDLGETPS